MMINRIIWYRRFVEKLWDKHGVEVHEAEEALLNHKRVRRVGRGHVQGEDVYLAMGQTDAGRYLSVPEEFKKLEEAGEFWDTQSAADHWDQMEDVVLEVDIRERRFAVLLEDAVYHAVEELAATEGVQPDTFLNEFLRRELVQP